tara:strand:+ start:781 stop:1548 length:768 start_codon:yes stop_codon:yes gene_type:complete
MKKINKTIQSLIDNNLLGVKVSFEDEGADFMDVIFLKAFCDKNKIPLTLKIAGAEAIRDIKDASKLQIEKLVAPMIESKFALEKFINSTDKYYSVENSKICINIESKQAYDNIDDIFSSSYINKLSSITVGRGDLVQSYEMDRYNGGVDSEHIFNITKKVFELARSKDIGCAVGGSMTADSENFIKKLIDENLLDIFETRNIMVKAEALKTHNFKDIIESALDFELNYLMFKYTMWDTLINHDKLRIQRLSKKNN